MKLLHIFLCLILSLCIVFTELNREVYDATSGCSPVGRRPSTVLVTTRNRIPSTVVKAREPTIINLFFLPCLSNVIINAQYHLVLVYVGSARYFPLVTCWRLSHAFTRSASNRHDWLVNYPPEPYASVARHRCAVFVDYCVDVRSHIFLFKTAHVVLSVYVWSPHRSFVPHVAYKGPRHRGGWKCRKYAAFEINPFLVNCPNLLRDGDVLTFETHCLKSSIPNAVWSDSSKVVASVPLRTLVPNMSKKQLRAAGEVHDVLTNSRNTSETIRQALENHECTCDDIVSIFGVVRRETVTAKASAARAARRSKAAPVPKQSPAFNKVKTDRAKRAEIRPPSGIPDTTPQFPPPPASGALRHSVITAMCKDLSPDTFAEVGCMVCGRLVPLTNATSSADIMLDLDILTRPGVTRKERHELHESVEELEGPVLDDTCDHICVYCESSLHRRLVPAHALVNNLWIGSVPWQLSGLTFAEKMLVAKVRHNRCVVRVASGRGKLIGNAIMFATPITKVYDSLPLSKDELSEILAFVFIGSAKPTEEDFARTPMLVRRQNVRDALEWLKLNHGDYATLLISEDNLMALPESGIYCGVEWKETTPDASNLVPEAMSVHNAGEEDEGTACGPCAFTVAGLTGKEYERADMRTLKLKALDHLKSGGKTLGVGQAADPESLFKNLQLYPQMFPWLFPYGKGGIGHPDNKYKVSDEAHKRHLLMYHDKRFQTDFYFPLVAFNDSQIKRAKTGSHLLVDKKNIKEVTNRLLQLDSVVLADLSKRLESGEHVKNKNPSEQACFDLIDDLEHVGSHVQGSLTSKKYMRNEVWSLISYKGAPTWFITFSPVDNNHPLCLYYADGKLEFSPKLRNSDERLRLISQNPVAAARFFHFVTEAFIKHVLGIGSDQPGLYGETDAYYGTVEQQGRLTLHMHMLIWIKGALSPQEIRDKMLDPDSDFQKAMIAYLESCHVGEFLTGTIADVRAKVPYHTKHRQGLHDVIVEEVWKPVPVQYSDPTQTLPQAPPPLCEKECDGPACQKCINLKAWWADYDETVDDLILRSNVHTCRRPVAGTDLTKAQPAGARIRAEVRGCLRKDGTCSARFPREVHPRTEVDPEDGSITVKKLEPNINTVTPDVTYCLRCNTDVTSLLSGTSIKAVVAYISDYVTKPSLKIYHMFDAVKAVVDDRTVEIAGLGHSKESKENTRIMLMQMVNHLTSKLQIGSPMACLYLLDNPDHYTNFKFRVCWWRSYLMAVRKDWPQPSDVGVGDNSEPADPGDQSERAVLMRSKGDVVGATNVDDYIHRPKDYEHCSVFDYVQVATRAKRSPKQLSEFLASLNDSAEMHIDSPVEDNSWVEDDLGPDAPKEALDEVASYPFAKDHPLWRTHYVRCDRRNLELMVPNFVGGSLPRMDQGDRETYCCTMLSLFKPWRRGSDLKTEVDSWHEAFTDYDFSDKARRLMRNFNVRYECNDARDDFSSQDRQKQRALPLFGGNQHLADGQDPVEGEQGETDYGLVFKQTSDIKGPKQLAKEAVMREAESVMISSGWTALVPNKTPLERMYPATRLAGSQWKAKLTKLKEEISAAKFKNAPPTLKRVVRPGDIYAENDVTLLDSYYFTKFFKAKEKKARKVIESVSTEYKLNAEQDRAFRLVANHSVDSSAPPLRMYLGGVGGTGKSQVIKALIKFFESRGEAHRFLVLGPTGTSAALLNGSTYHSVLGIRDTMDSDKFEGVKIRKIQERLRGVDYIFLDEVSMVSCNAMYSISARLALALGEPNEPFGGMNMIFAGDFAQLPPVSSNPLFSGDHSVSPVLHAKMSIADQKNSIGKILWQQITTVVILKQNMRQTHDSTDDTRFRTALSNMRFAACTKEDLEYLESRTISNRPGHPSFKDPSFHNVSMITAWNAQKDKINELGCLKFAAETGQELVNFFSNDTVANNAGDSDRKPKCVKKKVVVSVKTALPPDRQDQLWNAHPSFTSEHIPGKLSLCVGMPVMLRNNDATELCITKGQEAKVVGWEEAVGNHKQKILDTLFVELVSPPKNINVPGLPTNVVALTKASKAIWCTLPDDMAIQISREQVLVLPNFSMTDYASQGKTREFNVVDLNNCKTHFSYYTALSRSSTSAGTMIVQGLDYSKITRGISGFLRQEFRELETLNEITKLMYEGKLCKDVKGITRRDVLRSYHIWKKAPFDSADMHPVLRYKHGDDLHVKGDSMTGKWQLIGSDKPKIASATGRATDDASGNVKPKRTRKRKSADDPAVPTKKRAKKSPVEPVGLKWDRVNYSCAYDALFTCMFNIWEDHGPKWTDRFGTINAYTALLAKGFAAVANKTSSLETARDDLRQNLTKDQPIDLPQGPVLTTLGCLVEAIFGGTFWGSSTTKCTKCQVVAGQTPNFQCTVHITQENSLQNRFQDEYSLSHWMASQKITRSGRRCRNCGNGTSTFIAVQTPPPMLYVSLPANFILLDPSVLLEVDGSKVRYALRGVIYSGNNHFTARIIKENGNVWYHDGLETGASTESEGCIHDYPANFLLSCVTTDCTRRAAGAIYAIVD